MGRPKTKLMRKHYLLIAITLALWLGGTWASAQGAIAVVENTYQSRFGQEIIFRLVVEGDVAIRRVALFRQLDGEEGRVRAEVDFSPGRRVEAEYIWELESGELRPGVGISYWWLVEDASGRSLEVPPTLLNYEDDRFTWQELSQGPIRLYYYEGERQGAQAILDAATEAATRIEDHIGIKLEQPVSIYVYASRADMLPALAQRDATYDEQTVTLGLSTGGDTLLLLGSHDDVLQTTAHEMSHIIVGASTENPFTDLPRWLDEGLAMYAEGELPSDNAKALERAIRRDELISVRSLSAYVGDASLVDLYYGEAYSLVSFMLDAYGQEKTAELLDVLEEGVLPEEALNQVYGFGLDELDNRWRASLGLGPRTADTVEASSREERGGLTICSVAVLLPLLLGAATTRRGR